MSSNHISDTQVTHIAKLARLTISPEQTLVYKEQFNAILNYFDQLKDVSTDTVNPTSQVTGLVNVFREDIAGVSMLQSEVLKLAPESQDGYFIVHAVFATHEE